MNKKPTKYTYEEKESGMVSEPSAAVACNQPAVHMEIMRNEDHNDEAWTEWAKGMTSEEWSDLGDYYDSMDEDDPTQWTDTREFFVELEKEMKEYARKYTV